MATTKLYLDKRRGPKPDGTFSVAVILRHRNSSSYLHTGVFMTEKEWQSFSEKILSGKEPRTAAGQIARQYKSMIDGEISAMKITGRLNGLSAAEIKRAVLNKLGLEQSPETSTDNERGQFLSAYQRFMDSRETAGSRKIYRETLNRILAYDSKADALDFSDVTKDWLYSFDSFIQRTASASTRHRHLRNIRAVFNDAIDRDETTYYPFRKFKFPKLVETPKRALSVEELKMLRDYPVEAWQEEYRDIWLLMFYLIGINIGDLLRLGPDQIHNGRLEYRRAKTHKLYSVKIEPEAKALIEKYKGKKYLLSPLDRYGSYLDYLHHLNSALQKIGPVHLVEDRSGKRRKHDYRSIFPDITSYWARHTWATLAASLDIPIETISKALGHSVGSSVTNIYIKFDYKKIDSANRAVLDLLKK